MENKKQTLKQMQNELLDLVYTKYYGKDENISNCVDKIYNKQKLLEIQAEKRRNKKLSLGEKIKNIFSGISVTTLRFLDKLIIKEKVGNQIIGNKDSSELLKAEQEVKQELLKHEE